MMQRFLILLLLVNSALLLLNSHALTEKRAEYRLLKTEVQWMCLVDTDKGTKEEELCKEERTAK